MHSKDFLITEPLYLGELMISFSATISESAFGARTISSMHVQEGGSTITVELTDYKLDVLQHAIDLHRKHYQMKKNELAQIEFQKSQGVLSL